MALKSHVCFGLVWVYNRFVLDRFKYVSHMCFSYSCLLAAYSRGYSCARIFVTACGCWVCGLLYGVLVCDVYLRVYVSTGLVGSWSC